MKGCLNILILLAVFSCTKEGAGTAYTSIDAGQTQGESIYYTDRIPDDSVLFVAPSTYRQFGFDINRDQISDLTITANLSAGMGSHSYLFSAAAVTEGIQFCTISPDAAIADTLQKNSCIDRNCTWYDSTAVLSSYVSTMQQGSHQAGCWNNCGEKYIGFRLCTHTDTLYGWIRAEIRNLTTLYIRDYAYKMPKH